MKKLILILLIIMPVLLQAQQMNFKQLRFDEDYRYLAKDTSDNWYHHFKFLPLSVDKQNYLSFGGEFRSQYFKYTNAAWGDALPDDDGFALARYLLHADLHLSKYFRTFVQLQSGMSNGEIEEPSPVNENPLDLHQVFLDVSVPMKKGSAVLRLGRQELLYGSQRIVSVRDAPNNRQAFDGAKLMVNFKQVKLDAFYTHYVQVRKGIFDDDPTNATRFWGLYTTTTKLPFLGNLDLYYLGYQRKSANFDEGKGKELRHSLGARTVKGNGNLQYDLETLYQFGKFATSDISAWTISANISYTFSRLALHPKIGIKSEVISGDQSYSDDQLQTFNPLFPKGGYFGLAALIGPSNLFDIHPYIEVALTKKLIFTQDYDVFWRMERNDGIYAVNGRLLYSGKNTESKRIGAQLGSSLEYSPTAYLYFRGEFTWFNAGKYLKEVSTGKNITMFGATATFKF